MLTAAVYPPTDALTALDAPADQRDEILATPPLSPAQTHHVVLDRCRLERALAVLEAPDGVEAGPLRLACAHDALILSRSWAGMHLSTTVVLNTARNNLPRSGLVFEASEPFGALGGDGHLILGSPHGRSRRVEFTINPNAEHLTVTIGDTTRAVPAAFIGSDASAGAPSGVRLRRVFAGFAALPTDGASGTSPSGLVGLFDIPLLVSAEDLDGADGTITSLPFNELTRVLTRLDDLTDRLRLPNGRDRRDSSKILCRFDDGEASPAASEGTGYVSYLVLNENPFASITNFTKAPMTDFEVEIMPHGFALELACIRPKTPMEPGVFPALRTRTGRHCHYVKIRVPRATAQWACDQMGPEDRLMMGVSADGRVDVLLARVSDHPSFIVAPTMVDPVDPTPESVVPAAEPAKAA